MIDTAHRRHQRIRYVDETVKLPAYDGEIRQVAITGEQREQPTLFLSNNVKESARSLIVRYAGRNRIEDTLGSSVNFFHLDRLVSEVRLNVDLDTTLTVSLTQPDLARSRARPVESKDFLVAKSTRGLPVPVRGTGAKNVN